ncbi:MAG: hypothetical protein IK990_16615 [Ruminiclostridium sp.]|nr:hypothetical protein [Ruminiclostridium sp.]
MELKNFNDKELAERIIVYYDRLTDLKNMIDRYITNSDINLEFKIRREYEALKAEIREDANYLRQKRNRTENKLYSDYFVPSINGAATYGLIEKVNSKINVKMSATVEEALYRLRKLKPIDEWRKILSA